MVDYDFDLNFGNITLQESVEVADPIDMKMPMDHSNHAGHGGHGGHEGHGGHGGHAMFFSHDIPGSFLFQCLTIQSSSTLLLYCFATMLMGIIVEWLKKFRYKCQPPEKNHNEKLKRHIIDASLYFLQMTLSYFIMLIAMTFNYALFFSAMFGFALGHFIHHFPNSDSRCGENGCCLQENKDPENEKLRKAIVKDSDCC